MLTRWTRPKGGDVSYVGCLPTKRLFGVSCDESRRRAGVVYRQPRKSIDDVATVLAIPYEVVYALAVQWGLVIMPSEAGEVHFTHHS